MNAVDAYGDLKSHATKIQNDATHDLRETMEAGDAWAQGDILIRKLDSMPSAQEVTPESQLAEGTSQGSRHCLSTLEGVKMYRLKDADPLEGPIFTCSSDVTVEHPEHGDVILGPGTYAIEYQRAYAQELRRVQD